jgi:mono/diheme cytochrome c family protein
MPDGAAGEMPSFGPDQISDAQFANLYAYVTKAWK